MLCWPDNRRVYCPPGRSHMARPLFFSIAICTGRGPTAWWAFAAWSRWQLVKLVGPVQVFVAKPEKPVAITDILASNQAKLLKFLESLKPDKGEAPPEVAM
jgi:hypothetical protein